MGIPDCRAGFALLSLTLFVTAGACGGASGPASPTPGASASARATAYQSWATCARAHGANIGQPAFQAAGSVKVPPGEGSLSSVAELRAAMSACQPILSAAGFGPPGVVDLSASDLADLQAKSKAFAECLR